MVGLMADPTMDTVCPGVENKQGFSADINQVPIKHLRSPVPAARSLHAGGRTLGVGASTCWP